MDSNTSTPQFNNPSTENNFSPPTDDEFNVIFKGEALAKLLELAAYLNIPKNQLGDVLIKGMHIIDLSRDKRLIIESPQKKLEINLKQL